MARRPGCACSGSANGPGSPPSPRWAWSASTWPCSPPSAPRNRRSPASSWAAPRWSWPSRYRSWRGANPGAPCCTGRRSSRSARSRSRGGAVRTAPGSPSPPARWPVRWASPSSPSRCCGRWGHGCCPPRCAASRPSSRPSPACFWTARRGCAAPTAPRPPRCCGRRRWSPSSASCAGTWACSGSAPSARRCSPASSRSPPPAPPRSSERGPTGPPRPSAAPWWAPESPSAPAR
ncbi:hypothetical protein FBY22_5347 [Streptomyces sp. SLBN-31]|nr:hypothetical protein FBY22_5347 [Streptomyces sp. SLBN-31]